MDIRESAIGAAIFASLQYGGGSYLSYPQHKKVTRLSQLKHIDTPKPPTKRQKRRLKGKRP